MDRVKKNASFLDQNPYLHSDFRGLIIPDMGEAIKNTKMNTQAHQTSIGLFNDDEPYTGASAKYSLNKTISSIRGRPGCRSVNNYRTRKKSHMATRELFPIPHLDKNPTLDTFSASKSKMADNAMSSSFYTNSQPVRRIQVPKGSGQRRSQRKVMKKSDLYN